ncbi:MAG TPA: hypothetical protein PKH77_02690 [Anaerolineae bacterium]|nr:hypothetical protein [Anaerolineae bacterium]
MTTGYSALPPADDPFGLFAPVGGMVSFAVGAEHAAVERVVLPARADAAWAELAAARRGLQQGDGQLDHAIRRMTQVEARYQPGQIQMASFAASDMPAPELDLLHTLETLEMAAPEELAQLSRAQEDDLTRWEALVQQAQDKLAHPVQVKTQLGATLVGYTWMEWSGDFTTIFEDEVDSADKVIHHQAVELVLAKIMARLRLATVITSGAAQLIVKLSGPPGTQVFVVPAVLKYIRDVLAILRAQPDAPQF